MARQSRQLEEARKDPDRLLDEINDLPLLHRTPSSWAECAQSNIAEFLSDHAFCEQQAALTALHLVGLYADDEELVDRMTSLAAEEIAHLRRVAAILHRRGLHPRRRRTSSYATALHGRITRGDRWAKIDRLLVGALIEARSCERFTTLLHRLIGKDDEIAELLLDLGPAEKRHWRMFHGLAARDCPVDELEARWKGWLEFEAEQMRPRGIAPQVHG
ncbi:MAG: tRNA 2-methylthio-N6-isopentenyl adenosine(37) hydroxylase MiaE [Acidobacteriota bacterium]|nr:tRNA 2-methylthio-N6-isopentenyl adenosine(37) hydroxylase MiaE [Acidobacteriota bacterium]MDH3785763.1 tRNA 2-methylthio-N6-isopentenyl adenosine(37) hydroxylase MiaE [Acidobacteriota bacterium]